MSSTGQRSYAQESVISRPLGRHKQAVIALAVASIAFVLLVDLLDRRDHLFYFRSILAAIIAIGLIGSIWRYTRHIVDDVRAGPDYLIVRCNGVTTTIALEQIERVRQNEFISSYFTWTPGYLERIEMRLSPPSPLGPIVAFRPQPDWRECWTRTPMLRRLAAAD